MLRFFPSHSENFFVSQFSLQVVFLTSSTRPQLHFPLNFCYFEHLTTTWQRDCAPWRRWVDSSHMWEDGRFSSFSSLAIEWAESFLNSTRVMETRENIKIVNLCYVKKFSCISSFRWLTWCSPLFCISKKLQDYNRIILLDSFECSLRSERSLSNIFLMSISMQQHTIRLCCHSSFCSSIKWALMCSVTRI